MATINIRLNSGNTSNQKLDLSDHGSTRAHRRHVITWDIKEHSNVGSIPSIKIKPNSVNIFSSLGPNAHYTKWRGEIKANAPYSDCYYSIFWKDNDGNGPYEHDPKIAVKPITVDPLIAIAALVVTSLCSLFLYHKLKDRKRSVKKMKAKTLH